MLSVLVLVHDDRPECSIEAAKNNDEVFVLQQLKIACLGFMK